MSKCPYKNNSVEWLLWTRINDKEAHVRSMRDEVDKHYTSLKKLQSNIEEAEELIAETQAALDKITRKEK